MFSKVYTFHIFLALDSMYIISEAPNFDTTFGFMLIIIL